MNDSNDRTLNQITAANLRAAATLLNKHHDLPSPYVNTHSDGVVSLSWFLNLSHVGTGDEKADAASIVKAVRGTWDRSSREDLAEWTQARDGLRLSVQVSRDAVCERIVVGTTTVKVPAVKAQPARTVEQDIVEWRCEPLLAEALSS